MLKLTLALILATLAVTLAAPRVQLQRGLNAATIPGQPYLFLTVPRGRGSEVVQGFELIEENVDGDNSKANDNVVDDDDDDDDGNNFNANNNDDDDADDDDDNSPIVGLAQSGSTRAASSDEEIASNDNNSDDDDEEKNNDDDDGNESMENHKTNMLQIAGAKKNSPTTDTLQMILQNAKPTQLTVSKDKAGAILVPDGIIEIEGQSVIDEKTGKPAFLVPREALDIIPDGSVVALMERSIHTDAEEQARANRVIVRRRRYGSRRKVSRRGGNRAKKRRVNNYNNYNNNYGTYKPQRRRVKKRKNVRVVHRKGNNRNNSKRRGNKRRRNGNRTYVIQG